MKRICAWHPNNFGLELVMEDGTLPATHGICHLCATIEGERVNQQRLDSNAQFGEPYSPGSVPLNLDPVAEGISRRDLANGRDSIPWSDVGEAMADARAKKEEARKAQVRVQAIIVGNR